MVEGKMFSPQMKKLRPTEVKEPHHRVNNKESALQVALARVNLQSEFFCSQIGYITSISRHSNICWNHWEELLKMQLKGLYFIVVPFSMNYLKTFKLSIQTFSEMLSQKWAIRRAFQLNLTQKSHKKSMRNVWAGGGGGGWPIQLKYFVLKFRNEWKDSVRCFLNLF